MSITLQCLHTAPGKIDLLPFLPGASVPFTNMDIHVCLLWFGFSPGNPNLRSGRPPWPWEDIQNSKNRWNCETRTSFPISFVFPLWLRVASKSQLYGCNSPSLEWRQMEIESSCLHTYNSNFKLALSLYISFFP